MVVLYRLSYGSKKMAPQAGFEPATDRLTADSSTTELLWNAKKYVSLATSYSHRGKPPTTIGAKELNDRVRHGNGCDLFAIATRLILTDSTPTTVELFWMAGKAFFYLKKKCRVMYVLVAHLCTSILHYTGSTLDRLVNIILLSKILISYLAIKRGGLFCTASFNYCIKKGNKYV